MQVRPSSAHDSPFWTTNSGAPVWNNNASLTVGPRGGSFNFYIYITIMVSMPNFYVIFLKEIYIYIYIYNYNYFERFIYAQ